MNEILDFFALIRSSIRIISLCLPHYMRFGLTSAHGIQDELSYSIRAAGTLTIFRAAYAHKITRQTHRKPPDLMLRT